MSIQFSRYYNHLPPAFLTLEYRDNSLVLRILGELMIRNRIRQQGPILLGDIGFVLPRDVNTHSFTKGAVVCIKRSQAYVHTLLGFIRRKKENLWAITDSTIRHALERNQFPFDWEAPESYIEPPLRVIVNNIYFNRNVAT